MKKGILIFAILASAVGAVAQIPRTLQISVTNGIAALTSESAPGYFYGWLETTADLSGPWMGMTPPVLQTSAATNFPAAKTQSFFRFVQAWPVFEFAIFYNVNLEIDPGAVMVINGPVFSAAGIWAGTANVTFNSTVSAAGPVSLTSTDPFATGKADATAPPHFNFAGQPASGVAPLALHAFGTDARAMLDLPPAAYAAGTAGAYTTNGQLYLANAVDLIISNTINGTNWGSTLPKGTNLNIYFQDPLGAPYLKRLVPDFYRLKIAAATGLYTNYVSPNFSDAVLCYTNVDYAGWSFITNVAFFDYRESDAVQAVQVDLAKFSIWLTNHGVNGGAAYNSECVTDKGHAINSIWLYNGVPLTATVLPAVRMIHGAQLPGALTVATPMPIYVCGDYNTQIDATHVSSGTNTLYTHPAALMGDAITVLSGNWSDANNSGTSLGSRNASSTTVNAACLEGVVPSNPAISGNYGGGFENSLRYLESWSGATSTFNGSVVVMFPCAYATNYWIAPGTFYNPPIRNWGFDQNFLQASKLPPLTPLVDNSATR